LTKKIDWNRIVDGKEQTIMLEWLLNIMHKLRGEKNG